MVEPLDSSILLERRSLQRGGNRQVEGCFRSTLPVLVKRSDTQCAMEPVQPIRFCPKLRGVGANVGVLENAICDAPQARPLFSTPLEKSNTRHASHSVPYSHHAANLVGHFQTVLHVLAGRRNDSDRQMDHGEIVERDLDALPISDSSSDLETSGLHRFGCFQVAAPVRGVSDVVERRGDSM